jgi:hypothetical protein
MSRFGGTCFQHGSVVGGNEEPSGTGGTVKGVFFKVTVVKGHVSSAFGTLVSAAATTAATTASFCILGSL